MNHTEPGPGRVLMRYKLKVEISINKGYNTTTSSLPPTFVEMLVNIKMKE